MATAGDGATPYQSGGAGGKFRKKPIRRSAQATPYDRPPIALRNNSPSLFAKLVDPASRLIYAGADRLFGVFRKRLPSIAAPPPPETREEPEPSTDKGGNLASISATPEISELESILKQKTFTRSEIEHLTALLHGKSSNSDGDEGDRVKILSPSSHFLRLEASTSKQHHIEEREKENIHAAVSTQAVSSRVFEEDVASPAELARAYMGTRTPKVSPPTLRFGTQAARQDSALLNTTTILPRTPITSLTPRTTATTFKGYENGFTTPRSRGRSAIYSMARTPYSRPPSTFSQKAISSPALPLSQPAWDQERSIESSKMGYKRRSAVLDDIGSGGPVRRIRQKANLLSQGSPVIKNRSEKLLLRNEPESKSLKGVEEKGESSRSSLGSVPTKSTQTATKILEQLERFSPKEKSPVSRIAVTTEKVDSPSLKIMSSSQDNNSKKEAENARESTSTSVSQSKGKEKVEENGPTRMFAVPRNVLNGNVGVTLRENNNNDNGAVVVANTESTFKVPLEPPQKKRFQMSANEDDEADGDMRCNGHVSILKKPEASVFGNKDEVHKVSPPPPQVEKVAEAQKIDDGDVKSLPKTTDIGSREGGSVGNKKVTFNISPSNNKNNSEAKETQEKPTVIPTFGGATPFLFSGANQSSGWKANTSVEDAKPLPSTSSSSSLFSEKNSKKEENGINSFGGKNTSSSNGGANNNNTFATISPFPPPPCTTGSTSSSAFLPPTTTTTTTTSSAPMFNYGSPQMSGTTTTTSASPFGSSPSFGSTGFGLISPPPPTTTATTSLFGGSFGVAKSSSPPPAFPSFGLTSPAAAAAWQQPPTISSTSTSTSSPFAFGATSTSPSLFGSSTPPTSTPFAFTANSNSAPSQSQPIFGSTFTPASPNNNTTNNSNDQMSMDDTQHSTPTPTPTPSPPFGQPFSGGFMFGSPAPAQPSAVPFQFGGHTQQTNQQPNPFQAPPQNPFQASGSGDFSAAAGGGSFSLGSGGGDKSGRRILKIKKNRKK